jgi:hypothetical protein
VLYFELDAKGCFMTRQAAKLVPYRIDRVPSAPVVQPDGADVGVMAEPTASFPVNSAEVARTQGVDARVRFLLDNDETDYFASSFLDFFDFERE